MNTNYFLCKIVLDVLDLVTEVDLCPRLGITGGNIDHLLIEWVNSGYVSISL